MAAFGGGGLGPESSGKRRRGAARLPLELDVDELYVWQPGAGWQPLSGQLVDLSAGGAGLLVERPLPEATPVRFSVSIPALRMGKEGRVAHTESLPDAAGLWRVGIAFPPAPPSSTELLGARVVCWGAVLLVASSLGALWRNPVELVSLSALILILVGLAVGAELTYRGAFERYQEQRRRWELPIDTAVDSTADTSQPP